MTVGVLEKYKEYLPVTRDTPMFSLGEGDTPLVKSRSIGDLVGCQDLYFKLEGCNPTGSFKDRGMVVAVAKALYADAHFVDLSPIERAALTDAIGVVEKLLAREVAE